MSDFNNDFCLKMITDPEKANQAGNLLDYQVVSAKLIEKEEEIEERKKNFNN